MIQIEREITGALLVDPSVFPRVRSLMHPDEMEDRALRAVTRAIWILRTSDPPQEVTPGTVIAKLRSLGTWERDGINERLIYALDDLAVRRVVAAAPVNAQTIREAWQQRRSALIFKRAAEAIEQEPERAKEVYQVTEREMAQIWSARGSQVRDGSPKAIRAEREAQGNRPRGHSCGLAWVDYMTKGMSPGHYWIISGQYKKRKTTLAKMILLSLARRGIACVAYTTEGTRDSLYDGFISMLATARLRDMGVPPLDARQGWGLDARSLGMGLYLQEYHEPVEWAKDEFDTLPIELRDARDGVLELETLTSLIEIDRLNGMQVSLIDHLGNIQVARETDDNRMIRKATKILRGLTVRENITTLMISQKNEEANKNSQLPTAGLMGGGQAAQDADFIFTTVYNEKKAPSKVKINLPFSRWSQVGSHVYTIDPASGLILDTQRMPGQSQDEWIVDNAPPPPHEEYHHE